MKFFTALLFLLITGNAGAAVVDTVSIESKAMKTVRKCLVIRPFIEGQRPLPAPVLYLLHGYSGNHGDWLKRVPEVMEYADQYGVIIVCPDGGYGSWYYDSPIDPAFRYETYISKEVVAFIDSAYFTIRNRTGRAITGLSMGGHGALFLALRHPDVFGACGSMSGGVDVRSVKTKFDIAKRLGDSVKQAANWNQLTVMNVIDSYKKELPVKIYFDCGVDDFFYEDNKKLHQKMLKLRIPHIYTEGPGNHSWEYWRASLPYHMLFFSSFFRGK